jgi:hypothetical protein
MSYGVDQTRQNTLRIWLIVVSVLMVIGLTTAFFVSRAYRRYRKEQEENAAAHSLSTIDGEGGVPRSSSTPLPTATMTDLPRPTVTRTVTPTGTSQPDTTHTPSYDQNAFPYNVTDILYLSESYDRNRKWKPGDAVADNVSDNELNAIEDLLRNVHVQREQVFATETFPDYTLLNDGTAVSQLQSYYASSINQNDNCTTKIDIVGNQFRVFVIEFDGATARTMTVKIENRIDSCGVKSVTNDYYAYENLVRKFLTDDGAVWKVIEHTASMGVK